MKLQTPDVVCSEGSAHVHVISCLSGKVVLDAERGSCTSPLSLSSSPPCPADVYTTPSHNNGPESSNVASFDNLPSLQHKPQADLLGYMQ